MSSQPLWHGRFESGPSPELMAFSESLSFDRRLWADDIAGSQAHVAGLLAAGLLSTQDADALRAALDQVHAEFASGAFAFQPGDEDIHTAVERRVTELAGDAGARLHTGRSRNDQVATDLRLFVRRELRSVHDAALQLGHVLLEGAEGEAETPLPGFTHLQAAQPVSLAHHLLAHGWGLLRDLDRIADALRRADASPLGAGALGGSSLPLRPDATAAELGFTSVFANSMDAVSDRDFVADALYALAMLGVRLSKMGEEVVLWTSDAFGWAKLDESWSTGSSMLPQKKNPDIAELARGKSGRLIGNLTGFLTTLKGLPLAYNRDLQEDKEPLFDSLDQIARALPAWPACTGRCAGTARACGPPRTAPTSWPSTWPKPWCSGASPSAPPTPRSPPSSASRWRPAPIFRTSAATASGWSSRPAPWPPSAAAVRPAEPVRTPSAHRSRPSAPSSLNIRSSPRTRGPRLFPARLRPAKAKSLGSRFRGSERRQRNPCSMHDPAAPRPKVVLAYSGGLDTSIILKWLQTEMNAEVITFTADLGQGDELEPAREKALKLGIRPENIFIEDLRETFVRDFVFPMFRANTVYEGQYLLGTSIARPLIAQRQIEIARQVGAHAVCHGATGKGNDQVRFELGYYALEPDIQVIAPWREWDFKSRDALLAFAEQHQIPIAKDKQGEAPFSVDANLLHSSSEGKVLEDVSEARAGVRARPTIAPEDAPDTPTVISLDFARGDPVAIDGVYLSPAVLLARLNQLGHDNGIGRLDLVENRFVGMKSRGVYETPAGPFFWPRGAEWRASPWTGAPPT
jgi:argininosuccinate lyase/argininosuccinate synthase